MTTFTVVQVQRNKDREWTVQRSPLGQAFDLQRYYLSKRDADAEAERLSALDKKREIARWQLPS